jgi:pyrroloquinoline quinone biosynthesis protein B
VFRMKKLYIVLFLAALGACTQTEEKQCIEEGQEIEGELAMKTGKLTKTSLVILGTVQDAGSPHAACKKDCCRDLFLSPDKNRKVVSLGIVVPEANSKYLFEATPDMTEQMKMLKSYCADDVSETPDGIFLTHAHIGHYTGLMYLGKEAMNAKYVSVYAMPTMKTFLENNGPWSQLVTNENIIIRELWNEQEVILNGDVRVIPFKVPHRDEYSETVGYTIKGASKSVLFIPDIDKWAKWEKDIIAEIAKVDYAFIDATFYDGNEINNRDISEIPHPFIIESMELFKSLSKKEKSKIYFTHLNHTNPALNADSEQAKKIIAAGFNIARINDVIEL